MHGLGNDFVVIDDLGKPAALCHQLTPGLAAEICDRHFGIGADQIVWLKQAQGDSPNPLDARVEFINADGSSAEMCGNGMRAAALYLFKHGPVKKSAYVIETVGGVQYAEVSDDGQVSVNIGRPTLGGGFGDSKGELLAGIPLRFFEVNVGNPHAVIFLAEGESLESYPAAELGPKIERHARFPNRTNVEFVQVTGPDSIRVRVWERGAGLTLACGSGASASAVAAVATGKVKSPVTVELPGGSLRILWTQGEALRMEGPAEEVFRGEYFQRNIF
jgi:diaminopimelate epimerase